MAHRNNTALVVAVVVALASLANGFIAPPRSLFLGRSPMILYESESATASETLAPDKVLASEVKFWAALQQVFSGGLRKRDFFR